MFLVMFCPYGNSSFVPQVLCRTEREARQAILSMPRNDFGEYSYCYVPTLTPLSPMIYTPTNY